MKIEILGKPIALQRHRHYSGGTFDPQKKEKQDYALQVYSLVSKPPSKSVLAIEIDYVYVPPQSWSKKKRQNAMGALKISTPDLSNLIKFTEDALNDVLWEDDKQIAVLTAKKVYGIKNCTILSVEELDESNI